MQHTAPALGENQRQAYMAQVLVLLTTDNWKSSICAFTAASNSSSNSITHHNSKSISILLLFPPTPSNIQELQKNLLNRL